SFEVGGSINAPPLGALNWVGRSEGGASNSQPGGQRHHAHTRCRPPGSSAHRHKFSSQSVGTPDDRGVSDRGERVQFRPSEPKRSRLPRKPWLPAPPTPSPAPPLLSPGVLLPLSSPPDPLPGPVDDSCTVI